jgi:L-fuconate dehydratase
MIIKDLEVLDLRFPTSRTNAGTDAMHTDPDYSAAYVILKTDGDLEGHGLTFTIGRGNEICAAAIEAFRHHVVGQSLANLTLDLGGFWRRLAGDSQLRWLGPEKGVIHLALAAIVNAVWDLYAKSERKPLWKLLADMTPREIVSCIDFRYMTDALTAEEASDPWGPRARAAHVRLPRLHHLRRLDGILGRVHPAGVRTGALGGLEAFQGEGGRQPRGRRPSGADGP